MNTKLIFLLAGLSLACPKNQKTQEPSKTPLLSFEQDGRYGFRDVRGTVVIPAQYLSVTDFSSNGVAFVADDMGWSCIDTNNKVLLTPYLFDNGPDYVSEELFRYIENKKLGFANPECNIVIKAEYDFVAPFEEGRAAVCNSCVFVSDGDHSTIKGGSWGYLDKTGKLVIPMQYQSAQPFSGGKASVTQNDKTFMIDLAGTPAP
jgi:hypothetical protein